MTLDAALASSCFLLIYVVLKPKVNGLVVSSVLAGTAAVGGAPTVGEDSWVGNIFFLELKQTIRNHRHVYYQYVVNI